MFISLPYAEGKDSGLAKIRRSRFDTLPFIIPHSETFCPDGVPHSQGLGRVEGSAGRVHCYLDWGSGGSGAGFGMMIDANLAVISSPSPIPYLHVAPSAHSGIFSSHSGFQYIKDAQERLAKKFGLIAHVDILECELPGGVGLGTASQAIFATLLASIRSHERNGLNLPRSLFSWDTLRELSGQGRGSFIGLYGAEQGGVVITEGRDIPLNHLTSGHTQQIGKLSKILPWPLQWGITLIVPKLDCGITPTNELDLISQNFALWERDLANQIVHKDMLSSVSKSDLTGFAKACRELLRIGAKHREVMRIHDFTRRILYDESNRFPQNAVILSGAGPTIAIISKINQRPRLEKEYGEIANIIGPFSVIPTGMQWFSHTVEQNILRFKNRITIQNHLKKRVIAKEKKHVTRSKLNLETVKELPQTAISNLIQISAYPRIHISLLLMGGAYFRKYGDIGLSIEDDSLTTIVDAFQVDSFTEHTTYRQKIYEDSRLQVLTSNHVALDHDDANDIKKLGKTLSSCIQTLSKKRKHPIGVPFLRLIIQRRPPTHSGLGSKTQIKLALETAFFRANNLQVPNELLVQISGRGSTSSIGCVTFSKGGAVIGIGQPLHESGFETYTPSSRRQHAKPSEFLTRFDVPDSLFITLVQAKKDANIGINGLREREIFEKATPKLREDSIKALESAFTGVAPALKAGSSGLPMLRHAIDILHQPGIFKYDELKEQMQHTQELFAKLHYHFSNCAVGLSSMGNTIYVIGSHSVKNEVMTAFPSATVVGGGHVRNMGYRLSIDPKTLAP